MCTKTWTGHIYIGVRFVSIKFTSDPDLVGLGYSDGLEHKRSTCNYFSDSEPKALVQGRKIYTRGGIKRHGMKRPALNQEPR